MKTSLFIAGAVAGILLAAGSAEAAVVNLNIGQSLSGGGTYSGQFDISSYLVGYEVTSAQVVAFGQSAYNPQVQFGQYGPQQLVGAQTVLITPGYTSYAGGCLFGCYIPPVYGEDRTYESYRDRLVTDPIDTMVLDVGEASGGSSTSLHASTGSYAAIGSLVLGPNETGGINHLTQLQRTVENSYYGPLSTTVSLSANDLAGLNSSGLLNFSVKAQQGNFGLQSAYLTFDLRELSAAAPEPGTWAMMLVGFGLMGSALRHRRAASSAA